MSTKQIIFALLFSLTLAVPASAWPIFGQQVAYLGGTTPNVKSDEVGSLDTTQREALVFVSGNDRIAIPYDRISSIEYRRDVAIHLGVAPAIAIGILKRRERKHTFSFAYTDNEGTREAAIFEVSKEMPATLISILKAKAPSVCITTGEGGPSPCNRSKKW